MGPLDHELQKLSALMKSRGYGHILRAEPLPGGGIELICRLPNPSTPWNYLAHHLLLAFTPYPEVGFRIHRTLRRKEEKTAEGGCIQFWGPLPEVLQSIHQVVDRIPQIRPSPVEEMPLPHSQFYRPTANGGGAFPYGDFVNLPERKARGAGVQ